MPGKTRVFWEKSIWEENAAYQMMKLAGVCNLQIKAGEKVTRIKAA